MSRELSPLAAELRRTVQQIGPCTGFDAWKDIAIRIATCEFELDGLQLAGVDLQGHPRIRREQLDAALVEAELAGGLHCRNLRASGATETYSWRPLPEQPATPPQRQRGLFESET